MTDELSKGFTGIEINGVRFSNIKEMLIHINKQRDHILDLEKENEIFKKANEIIAQQRDNRDADIAELEKENERLKGDLELWENGACRATNLDKCGVVKELEAQIEKMKCCENCNNFNNFQEHCELDATHSVECHCNIYKLWEIKEK